MGDYWDAWWQQTYQVKSIVLGKCAQNYVNKGIDLVRLLPPSVPKSPIVCIYTHFDRRIETKTKVSVHFITRLYRCNKFNFIISNFERSNPLINNSVSSEQFCIKIALKWFLNFKVKMN